MITVGLGNNWRKDIPDDFVDSNERPDRYLSVESRLTALQSWVQHQIALEADPNSILVFSGGKTNQDVPYSEAEAMLIYLEEQGIHIGENLLIDEDSLNTPENARNVFDLLEANHHPTDSDITVVSSPYHTRRVLQTFKKMFRDATIRTVDSTEPIEGETKRNDFARKIEQSLDWRKKAIVDEMLRLIGLIDTQDSLIRLLTRRRGK